MRLINSNGSSYLYKMNSSRYEIHSRKEIIESISQIGLELTDIKQHGGERPTAEIESTLIKKSFYAKSVTTLKTFIAKKENRKGIPYDKILRVLQNIGIQILILKNINKGIVFFSLEDIIVIDEQYFLFLNTDKIFDINKETKKMTINVPLTYKQQSSFIPPELNDMSVIPFEVYYTSEYCSFSMLCVFLFLGITIEGKEEEYEKISNPFLFTQLYFCLKRCIKNIPEQRSLIYV